MGDFTERAFIVNQQFFYEFYFLVNKILFNGSWCFNVHPSQEKDSCEIVGSEGSIQFSFFEPQPICLKAGSQIQNLNFDPLQHVQQPMIEKVVNYFLNKGENPNSGGEAATVMQWMEQMTTR